MRTRSEWCRDKLDVSIDARTDRGRELILRLVADADVVVNNFSVGVMDRLGLGYEALSERRSELIYVDLQGFGQTGPRRDWVTYGPSQMAFAGFTHLWNQPDQPEPVVSQLSHPDFVAAAHAALAILAALHARRRTGRGQRIDIAQFETSLAMLGPLVSEALITGVERQPLGNRSEAWAPQGCYPCRGADRWVAIEVRTDDEWRRLGEAIEGEWVDEGRFADNAGRLTHAGELDELIADWTRDRDAEELAELLQNEGVRAVLVFDSRDLHDDRHLMERGYLQEIDHPDLPRPVRYGADPLVFRRRHQPLVVRAPRLGEDNEYVLGSILGLAPGEIERLIADKVVW